MDTQARENALRKAPSLAPRFWLAFGVLAIGAAVAALRPGAAPEAAATDIATAEELHEIVGPVALYPDDLVAIVLPASTYPLQIVQAARFLEDRERNSSLKPNEEWDDSIVALLNYPEVIKLLNDDLDWTYDLGTAVLNQRADVLSAIQDFRNEAYAAGNLRSDERQTVARESDTIEIKPADPKVIYVPYYEPERVVVYQPAPVYYYYPRPYPVYYYPYPEHYHFSTGFFWGVNSWFSIGWHTHHVHVYDPFYHGHPYYGWTYHHPHYVRDVYVNVNHYHRPSYVWQPQYRYGGRPVTRGSEGRVYTADRRPRHGALDTNAAATRTREGSAYRTPASAGRTSGRGALDANAAAARTREGSTNRAAANPSTPARAQSGTPQARRDLPNASYRSRTEGTQPQAAQGSRPNGAPVGRSTQARGPVGQSAQSQTTTGRGTQAREPVGHVAQPREPSTGTSPGAHRGNGGMPQAMRNRAPSQPNTAAAGSPGVSPRALERSTGMPRESSRAASAPARQASPPVRAQSYGGGMSAQRSESGSSARASSGGGNPGRGNSGGDNGGSYRGGGGSARSSHHTR